MYSIRRTGCFSYLIVFIGVLLPQLSLASQSSITQAAGSACRMKQQTNTSVESQALLNAKRQAVEFAQTHISVQSKVSNFKLEKDIIKSFAEANVTVLSVLKKYWDNKKKCYSINIMAEVIPVNSLLANNDLLMMNNPSAPLTVKIWTDHAEYKTGQYMTIYLKGNKPFYGRLLYKDAAGNLLQILPNPNRKNNFFNGSVVYQIPNAEDAFELLIEPPFGDEMLTLYASTAPLGKIDKVNAGAVYKVTESSEKIAYKTRGIRIVTNQGNFKDDNYRKNKLVEFAETSTNTVILK